MNWKEIVIWVGGIGTVLTVIITMLWGVPYYITVQVAEQVAAISANAGKPQSVTDLETQNAVIIQRLDTLDASSRRIEGKQDGFSNIFTAYLERQSQ